MVAVSPIRFDHLMSQLRTQHPGVVRPWFEHLSINEVNGGVLEVRARNNAQRRYLIDWCSRPFADAASACSGRLVFVNFIAADGDNSDEPGDEAAFRGEDSFPLLNPNYDFDGFIIGPCNRMGHAACKAVSDHPGQAYNPLFIHGDVGLGKTHLLQAVCHALFNRPEPLRVLYLTCETFTNHFFEAVERGLLHSFRYRYRHVDALVIDDIQFLAKRERSQEEFFHTFNTLYQSQKQIILTADTPPRDIPSLENRLISRFNSGLVLGLDPPCFETRMAIVRKKCLARSLNLSDDVIEWIANRVSSNIRELEGAIIKVQAFAEDRGGALDIETARLALGDDDGMPPPAPTMQDILELVVNHYKVRLADLQGKKRNRTIAVPRQICMYLGRELTALSLEEIGGYLGGRDHSTVIHAHRNIKHLAQRDPSTAKTLEGLSDRLNQSVRSRPSGAVQT